MVLGLTSAVSQKDVTSFYPRGVSGAEARGLLPRTKGDWEGLPKADRPPLLPSGLQEGPDNVSEWVWGCPGLMLGV